MWSTLCRPHCIWEGGWNSTGCNVGPWIDKNPGQWSIYFQGWIVTISDTSLSFSLTWLITLTCRTPMTHPDSDSWLIYCLSPTRAFVFCLAYPTRRGPSYFVSHLLVVLTTWHFLSHQSWVRLDLVLVHHRTEALIRLHSTKNRNPKRTLHDNASHGITLSQVSRHRGFD